MTLTLTRLEVLRLFRDKKIDPEAFPTLVAAITTKLAERDQRIANLEERLRRRAKRQQQRQNTKPGRGRGRPRAYDSSPEYHWYWLFEADRGNTRTITEWLAGVKLNRDGKPMTDGERRHIRKILSTLMPAHIKLLNKGCKPFMTNELFGKSKIDEFEGHDPSCAGCPDCEGYD